MEVSRQVVHRHWWSMFGLMIVLAIVACAGFLACFVGALISIPVASASLMYVYEDLFGQRAEVARPPETLAWHRAGRLQTLGPVRLKPDRRRMSSPVSSEAGHHVRTRLDIYATVERGLHPFGRERRLTDARAGRVEDGVGDRPGGDGDRGFSGAGGPRIGLVDEHGLDRRQIGAEIQRPIRPPIDRRDLLIVPHDFFEQRAAHALQRAALELIPQAVRDSRSGRSRWRSPCASPSRARCPGSRRLPRPSRSSRCLPRTARTRCRGPTRRRSGGCRAAATAASASRRLSPRI